MLLLLLVSLLVPSGDVSSKDSSNGGSGVGVGVGNTNNTNGSISGN